MKIPRIANAVGHIDDDLITAAECNKTQHNTWLKWGSIAACFAVLAIAGATILPTFFSRTELPIETNDRYKNHQIQEATGAIAWSWDYKTIYEKYTSLALDGAQYGNHGRTVSESLIGELIGTHSVVGYDNITHNTYAEEFAVYQLKHADKSQYVAVKMEDACYVFHNDGYNPPSTLGEVFKSVDLPKAIELSRFSENGDGENAKHFALHNDDYVWSVLAGCEDARFIEDDRWTANDREHLSFTVTSETLGVYKVALYITADGYLWTNAFDYQYLFDIGEDAAGKIIKYAKENSTEAQYEPYQKAIVGKIVEITDDYILIDDSVLCNDSADGITYKVLLNDIRISRYVEHGVVKVGDTAQVVYTGEVDKQNNTIDSAGRIAKVRIYFENEEESSQSAGGETVTVTTSKASNARVPE